MIQHFAFILAFHASGFQAGASLAEGRENKLSCVNDYVVTINCSLVMPTESFDTRNGSYLLEFQRNDGAKFNCPLTKAGDSYSCAFKSSDTFSDGDRFMITLRGVANKTATVMEHTYMPVAHIKPLTPGNLTLHQLAGGYNFTWDNGYESIRPPVFLISYLKYKLLYYKSRHPDTAVESTVHNKSFYLEELESDTEYVAQVCSSPIQMHYRGEWSMWSHAVRWRTNKQKNNTEFLMFGMVVFLCIPVGMIFWLKTRLKTNTHSQVPSPAPFFHTLYTNYKGDFRRWLVSQGNLGGPLKIDTLNIDTLTEAGPIDRENVFITPPFLSTPCPAVYVNPCSCFSNSEGEQDTLFSASVLTPDLPPLDQDGDPKAEGLQHWPLCSLTAESKGTNHSEEYCTLLGMQNDFVSCAILKQAASNTRSCKSEHTCNCNPLLGRP